MSSLFGMELLVALASGSAAQMADDPSKRDVWLEKAHSSDPKERLWALSNVMHEAPATDATVRATIVLALDDDALDVHEAALTGSPDAEARRAAARALSSVDSNRLEAFLPASSAKTRHSRGSCRA